jgi:hypothetical protein
LFWPHAEHGVIFRLTKTDFEIHDVDQTSRSLSWCGDKAPAQKAGPISFKLISNLIEIKGEAPSAGLA